MTTNNLQFGRILTAIRGVGAAQAAFLVAGLALLAGAVGGLGWLAWQETLGAARRELAREADSAAATALRILEGQRLAANLINEVLHGLADEEIRQREAELHARIATVLQRLRTVQTAAVVDRTGRLLVTATLYPAPSELDYATREWFQALAAPVAPDVHVSPVAVSRFDGQLFFSLSKRRGMTGNGVAPGAFDGVVAIAMNPNAVASAFIESLGGTTDVISLVRFDGRILVRTPRVDGILPDIPSASPLRAAAAQGVPRGIYVGQVLLPAADETPPSRLVAFRQVEGMPLYVTASRLMPEIASVWRDAMLRSLAVALPAGLALVLLATLAWRRSRAAEAARQALLREAGLRRMNEGLEARVREEVAAREEAQARLAQAQRMEALGQLAGGIAHDFNNVLQAVQGGARLIQGEPGRVERVRRLATMIADATARGAGITRRLLAFARRADLRAEPVAPQELLGAMREMFRHTLGAGIEVRVQVAPGVPALLADRGQLETVLVNLAANARDAMSGAGSLVLSAVAEKVEAGGGTPAELRPGTYVRVSVSDTGAGMDAATLARAAEPFFTTKPQGQGTGLGLAMARGFAEQSGGALHIESAPGRGTTVRLWFPVSPASERSGASPGAAWPSRSEPGVRVLLVDDEPLVREITAEGLEKAGYQVLSVESAAEALELLDDGAGVDVLLTDLSMPGMDGWGLIAEAQRRRPGLPAILLTGFANDMAELAMGGAMSGRFSLLRKPAEVTVLAERIDALAKAAAHRASPEPG